MNYDTHYDFSNAEIGGEENGRMITYKICDICGRKVRTNCGYEIKWKTGKSVGWCRRGLCIKCANKVEEAIRALVEEGER